MFSFRSTPLSEQLDRSLNEGKVACFCTQNCWDMEEGRYLYDLFTSRGNLARIFSPRDSELTPQTNHIDFQEADLQGLSAIVVEIQDVGVRYFNYTKDVFRLMGVLRKMENPPSLYIVDHINPAGRIVEGCMPEKELSDCPKIAHRHGLTLGELANLYQSEINAKFALHVISANAGNSSRQPWAIPPASDIPSLFTYDLYSGGGLWNNTNISCGIGTTRPYEYIGAPFVKPISSEFLPQAPGVTIRPCSFTPAFGLYAGRKCYGYQLMLQPGAQYHSLMHTLQLIRYFNDRYPSEFKIDDLFDEKLSDSLLRDYLRNKVSWDQAREHIKIEEQKWIRKVKKFLLYDDPPYRIK